MILTKAQRVAVYRKYTHSPDGSKNYLDFRRRVFPEIGNYGCVMLPWCGMLLGIEPDGYTHS